MTIKEKLNTLENDTIIIGRNLLGFEEEITKDYALDNIEDIYRGFHHETEPNTIVLIMDI